VYADGQTQSRVRTPLTTRSVEIIRDGQAPSGAYAASPTFPQYRDYCWFRDGAFIADAMSRAGETESAERFFDWCAAIVRAKPDGPWDSRYRLDGSPDRVAWWPHRQFDGLGLWVWAMRGHVARHRADPRWEDAAAATAAFLAQHWQEPCHDWWEEREGVHAVTLGCIWAALGGDEIAAASRNRCEHERVDGSHAFLVVLGLADEHVLERVERTLGYHRHGDDEYYGGGEWPLLTAMLGLAKPARAEECLRWIEAHAAANGDLPEQSQDHLLRPERHRPSVERWGEPPSPLLWSHAMYLRLHHALRDRR
jgi:isomaltose glucohydrolase